MSLARILGKQTGRPSYMSDSRWVLPTCFIGLEHEYEGVENRTLPKHTFADFWQYHEEGSLKDNGAEYAYANPLFGADAYNALEWLVSHAKDSKWKCSKRTGIHVHLDVRDLTIPQFAGMSILYAALEPILYHWVGGGRASSHFCIPLYRADEALLDACKILRAAHLDDKEEGADNALVAAERFQRYAGYNLQALHKFGSVEFRQLETTHDLTRIVDWVNMIMSLKAGALKLPQSDGATIHMLERMDTREVLNYIFPSELATKLYTPVSDYEFRTVGLPTARDIAVHGCGDLAWVASDYPKGENPGFIKWIKDKKKPVKAKRIDIEEFDVDAPPDRDEDLVHFDPEAPPPMEALIPTPAPPPIRLEPINPPAGQAAGELRGWGGDWANPAVPGDGIQGLLEAERRRLLQADLERIRRRGVEAAAALNRTRPRVRPR
jgi:Putative amidoligase enzyme